jgi:hypothetical protein
MKTRYVLNAAILFTAVVMPMAAGSITTTFADNNRFTGNMFDAVIGANGLTVNSLDVNVDSGAVTIDVYIKTGTFVGSETNPAAWTLVSATNVTGAGAGNQTLVAVTPFTLSAGETYGIYVTTSVTTNATPYMWYTNGTNSYSNADLTLNTGDGIGGQFGSITVNAARTWDGTINYTLANTTAPEPTSLALFGLSCVAAIFANKRRSR